MRLLKSFASFATILTLFTAPLKAETFELSPQEKACLQTLDACSDTVEKADKALKDKQAVINIQKKQSEELAKQLVQVQSERDSLWRNPWLWFFIGASVGGLAAGLVAH